MDLKLKTALDAAFYAPPPERKTAFLRAHRSRELTDADLLLIQVRYVRWWMWAGSLVLFGLILWIGAKPEMGSVWMATDLVPLMALLAVSEWSRSRRYCMDELELSCRTPLRIVLMARMVSVGLFHLLLLGLSAPVLALWGGVGVLRAGLYLLTPYLFAAAIGMELSRRMQGKEGLLACIAATVLVCILGTWSQGIRPDLYQMESLPFWWTALLLTTAAFVLNVFKLMKGTGELQWN